MKETLKPPLLLLLLLLWFSRYIYRHLLLNIEYNTTVCLLISILIFQFTMAPVKSNPDLMDSQSTQIKQDVISNYENDEDQSGHVVLSEEIANVTNIAAEKALCRKFDLRLLPVLAVMVSRWK